MPSFIIKSIHKISKSHNLDKDTVEEMINLFELDVDGKHLTYQKLLGRRNYLEIDTDLFSSNLKCTMYFESVNKKYTVTYTVVVPTIKN